MGQPQQNRCEGDEVLRDILGALSYGPLGLSGASGAHTTLPKEQCPQGSEKPHVSDHGTTWRTDFETTLSFPSSSHF